MIEWGVHCCLVSFELNDQFVSANFILCKVNVFKNQKSNKEKYNWHWNSMPLLHSMATQMMALWFSVLQPHSYNTHVYWKLFSIQSVKKIKQLKKRIQIEWRWTFRSAIRREKGEERLREMKRKTFMNVLSIDFRPKKEKRNKTFDRLRL